MRHGDADRNPLLDFGLPRSPALRCRAKGIARAPSGFAWKSAKPLIDELLAAVLPNLSKQYYWAIGRANKMRVARAKAAAGRLEHKQPKQALAPRAQDAYNLTGGRPPEFPVAPSRVQLIGTAPSLRAAIPNSKNRRVRGLAPSLEPANEFFWGVEKDGALFPGQAPSQCLKITHYSGPQSPGLMQP
jgi:hypothetical protein